MMIDGEDTPPGTIHRLRLLGLTDEDMTQWLTYIGPNEGLSPVAMAELGAAVASTNPALILVDGVNAVMVMLGLDMNSNVDATLFAHRLLDPLAATGAVVVTIDHVPKNGDGTRPGAIGAQAKRASVTGCLLTVKMKSQPMPGGVGVLILEVDKDRLGQVRQWSAFAGRVFATAVVGSDSLTGAVTVDLRPTHEREVVPDGETAARYRVSQALEASPEPVSRSELARLVGGRRAEVLAALDALIAGGFVIAWEGPRGAVLNDLKMVYSHLNGPV